MSIGKRVVSPHFWHRAIASHGFWGVVRAGARHIKPRRIDEPDYLDLTATTDDPIAAIYLGVELGRTPLIMFPVAQLRVEKLGIRVDDLVANPYTRSVVDYLSGEQLEYEGSALHQFLESWQPRTLADVLGLENVSPASPLTGPALAEVLPWTRAISSEELAQLRASNERSWALKFGPPPDGAHGSTTYGPASMALGRYRFAKHTDVARSLAAKIEGSDRSDFQWYNRGGFIEVQLLVDGERLAGVVREGKHRSPGLAALGADLVVVSLPATYPVIRRDEVASWPGVKAGVFSVDEALTVFDRFMEGAPPWPQDT